MKSLKADLLLSALEDSEFQHRLVRLMWNDKPFALVRSFSSHYEKAPSREVVVITDPKIAKEILLNLIDISMRNKSLIVENKELATEILKFGSSLNTKVNIETNSLQFFKTTKLMKLTGRNHDEVSVFHIEETGYGLYSSKGAHVGIDLQEVIKGFIDESKIVVDNFLVSNEKLLYLFINKTDEIIGISKADGVFKIMVDGHEHKEVFQDEAIAKEKFLELVAERSEQVKDVTAVPKI
jgi:hypothetical protein